MQVLSSKGVLKKQHSAKFPPGFGGLRGLFYARRENCQTMRIFSGTAKNAHEMTIHQRRGCTNPSNPSNSVDALFIGAQGQGFGKRKPLRHEAQP